MNHPTEPPHLVKMLIGITAVMVILLTGVTLGVLADAVTITPIAGAHRESQAPRRNRRKATHARYCNWTAATDLKQTMARQKPALRPVPSPAVSRMPMPSSAVRNRYESTNKNCSSCWHCGDSSHETTPDIRDHQGNRTLLDRFHPNAATCTPATLARRRIELMKNSDVLSR